MKLMSLMAPILCLLSPLHAFAGRESGGGSQIESAFRLRAYALTVKVANNVEANALCPSADMQSGLDTSQVRVVDQLTDSSRKVPPNLDAWTMPGDIQLLKGTWDFLVNPALPERVKHDKSVDQLILHEIYRTTRSCNDNNFRISNKAFGYLEGIGTSKFSEVFVFKYPYYVYDLGSLASWYLLSNPDYAGNGRPYVCDQPIKIARHSTCIRFMKSNPSHNYFKLTHELAFSAREDNAHQADFEVMSEAAGAEFFVTDSTNDPYGSSDVENQWLHVSPQHPFIVVHDIANGTWSAGLR